MTSRKHLRRLDRVWVNDPVFYITICTSERKPFLTTPEFTEILIEEWHGAANRHGWFVGRYVIMPDHVHFFCSQGDGNREDRSEMSNPSAITDPSEMKGQSEITEPSEMKRQSEITDLGYSEMRVKSLSGFIQQWKQWTSKRILREFRICSPDGSSGRDGSSGYDGPLRLHAPIWQAEFFDHLLRSEESYAQKWEYVRDNPVRKRLVKVPDDWPWQGEVYHL